MPYLGRKIGSRDNWEVSPGLGADEVSAQMLTSGNELRAKNDSLSFYESSLPSDEAVQLTALAFAAAGNRLDPVSVAWVDKASLEADGIALQSTAGNTPVKDLRDAHVEAVRLDGFRLAKVASRLAAAVRGNVQLRMLTREEVRQLLQAAVDARRVGYTELKVELREELKPPT